LQLALFWHFSVINLYLKANPLIPSDLALRNHQVNISSVSRILDGPRNQEADKLLQLDLANADHRIHVFRDALGVD
jgi:hypothetical protein